MRLSAILFALAFVSGPAACADATAPALFGPVATDDHLGPINASNVAAARARANGLGLVKSMQTRWINRLAIDSDAIVIELDGTQYWFFRTAASLGGYPPGASWTGETSAGDRLQIDQSIQNMVGSFNIGARAFTFGAGQGEYVVLSELAKKSDQPTEVQRRKIELANAQPAIAEGPTKDEECAAIARALKDDLPMRIPQPPYMFRYLDKVSGGVKSRQLELACPPN